MLCTDFLITARDEIAADVFDYRIDAPQLCAQAEPGQFVHVGVPGFSLRRPISICGIDPEEGELRLVFEARGEGTRTLSRQKIGDKMDLLGPLGHGFTLLREDAMSDTGARVAVVGGGIGTPPLLPLAQYYGDRCNAILGFRSEANVLLDVDFASYCDTVTCTDDGSYGTQGNVTPALEALLQAARLDMVYACGPYAMLRAVRALCLSYGVRCQLSLEERMACGVGACLGCAVQINRQGKQTYLHVCKDGPVFEGGDVVFD